VRLLFYAMPSTQTKPIISQRVIQCDECSFLRSPVSFPDQPNKQLSAQCSVLSDQWSVRQSVRQSVAVRGGQSQQQHSLHCFSLQSHL